LGGRLRTQSDVFHYTIKDLQVEITELPAGQVTKNAARAAGTGAELNAQFAITSQWTVEAGGAYLHARYTSYPDATLYVLAPTGGYAVSAGNLGGSPVEQSPTFIGDASIDYKSKILDKWNVNFHAVGRYSTKYDFYPGGESAEDGSSQAAYGLVNLSAGVAPEGGHYKVGVYVNNATNTKYDNLKTYYSSGFFHMPAAPITYGMTLRYDF
jgi:iron complex outermembrane recepter protein